MSVFNALNTAIYSKLSGGTALVSALGGTAVYYLQAPDSANPPFVVWSYQAGGDDNLTPHRMKNNVLNVRCYGQTPAQSGSIDALVDARLNRATLSITGWTNFYTTREMDMSLIETEPNGRKNYVSVGFYRIRLSKT